MKKIITTTVALLLVASLTAQGFSFGPRAGLTMQQPWGVEIFDGNRTAESLFTPGFNIGLVAEYAFSESFAVQIGALFAQTRFSERWNWGAGDDEEHERWRMSINQLQVPINLQYTIPNTGIFFQVGPFLGFNLGGTVRGDGVEWTGGGLQSFDYSIDIAFGNEPPALDDDAENGGRAFNFGASLGFGLDVNNFRLAFTYNLGLRNMYNGYRDWSTGEVVTIDDLVRRQHGFMITLTKMFGGNGGGRW